MNQGATAPSRTRAYAAGGVAIAFVASWLLTIPRPPPRWELDLTEWVNDAPDWFAHALWPVMQLGTLWAPFVVGVVAAIAFGVRRGFAVFASGLTAWVIARSVKSIVERGRPLDYLPDINVREHGGHGLGYISGHTAVAFALAASIAPALPRWGRVVVYGLATLTGIARIVYGKHLPVDVLGGAAAGILAAWAVEIIVRPAVRARE